jgi:hypothetical protein
MQRKKARHKIAKLFRKIGIEFEDTYKIAKQILKEGLVYEPSIKIELKYLSMCDCCGPILQGYKGPSGIVTTEQILQILRKTK